MNTPSYHVSKSTTKTMKILGAAVLAAAFGLAPHPAFAQHGGGGGGGHSGGGGGHASGGSSAGSSGGHFSGGTPVHASAPHATVGGAGRPAGMAPRSGTAGMANFNAARNRFVDPPSISSSSSSRAVARRPFFGSSNPAVVQPRSPFLGRRRDFFFFGEGGCFNGFFPGFCGGFFPFGFGFGFSPWGFGFGPWGYGYDGFGYSNYGYPYDSSMSGDIEANVEGQTSNMENRLEDNPYYGAEAESLAPSLSNDSRSDASASAPLVMLYLKDGSVYALSNYWVADGKLHYKTQYGGENSVPLDQIDIQHTVDVNAKRGVSITLRPAPDAAPAPQPSPTPAPEAAPAPQPNLAPNSVANLSRQLR